MDKVVTLEVPPAPDERVSTSSSGPLTTLKRTISGSARKLKDTTRRKVEVAVSAAGKIKDYCSFACKCLISTD